MADVENVVFKKNNQESTYPVRDSRLNGKNLYEITYEQETISIKEEKVNE